MTVKENWGDFMITAVKSRNSLTFYQQPPTSKKKISVNKSGNIISTSLPNISVKTEMTTNKYNAQLERYLVFSDEQQGLLIQKTKSVMEKISENNTVITNGKLRDKINWPLVKKFVTRQELMKLQISGKCDLPLTKNEQEEILSMIKDKNLADLTDDELSSIIDDIVSYNPRKFLDALKDFKASGQANSLLQTEKINDLAKALDSVNLNRISAKELKNLQKEYYEGNEYHHLTSVSADPEKQSVADNILPVKKSKHSELHIDPETGKLKYALPQNKPLLNRKRDMKIGNQKRVRSNEIRGFQLLLAIGAGIGFTIGFATTLAENGISPDSMKQAVIDGGKSSVSSTAQTIISYGIGRTIGMTVTDAVSGIMSNCGLAISKELCNIGVVGLVTTTVFSVYQFIRLKKAGVATKEAVNLVGRQAMLSLSLIAVSIAAQCVLGSAGIFVSIGFGVVIVAYSLADTVHKRKFAETIQIYTIEHCKPMIA